MVGILRFHNRLNEFVREAKRIYQLQQSMMIEKEVSKVEEEEKTLKKPKKKIIESKIKIKKSVYDSIQRASGKELKKDDIYSKQMVMVMRKAYQDAEQSR